MFADSVPFGLELYGGLLLHRPIMTVAAAVPRF
jgi:hypothetical protein